MKKDKVKVSIGIPAYQSEANIGKLLRSLISQKGKDIEIKEILVYTDACTDNTAGEVKKIKSRKIRLIEGKINKGYAFGLQKLIDESAGKIFVALNDDIKITSKSVINNLVQPILKNPGVGLVSGNICALKPRTFIGKCIYTSYLAFESLRMNYKNGLSRLTNDGKIMALSKKFAKSLKLNASSVGNVDIYIYLENLRQGNLYSFAKNSKVFFRMPETISDFRDWESRTKKSEEITKKQFSQLADEEWKIPLKDYLLSLVKVFLRYPLEATIFKFFINGFIYQDNRVNFRTWRIGESTKKL